MYLSLSSSKENTKDKIDNPICLCALYARQSVRAEYG